MAYTIKIENGKANVYENGALRRTLGSKVSYAVCDGVHIACIEGGGFFSGAKVKVYSTANWGEKRVFGESGAVGLQLSGDTLAVSYSNGKTKEYSISRGAMVRRY